MREEDTETVFSGFPEDEPVRPVLRLATYDDANDYDGPRTPYGFEEWPDPEVSARFILSTRRLPDGTVQEGGPRKNMANLILIFREDRWWAGCIGFDELSYLIVIRDTAESPWRPLSDSAVTNARAWVSRLYGLDYSEDDIFKAISSVAEENKFNSVVEYLESLVWDETPRIDKWLHTYLGALDTELISDIGKFWMLGAAKRALEPGCQMDSMIVIKGLQGKGKSKTARILARTKSEGGPLPDDAFCDMPNDINNKDTLQSIAGSWIVEVGELDAMRNREVTAIRQFLTKKKDKFRPPYGRLSVTFQRHCAFFGTTNEDDILKDPAGSRRFWVVVVELLREFELKRDIDQLWAEAVYYVKQGVLPFLSEEMDKERAESNKDFEEIHPWQHYIVSWIEKNEELSLTNPNLLEFAIGIRPADQDQRSKEQVRRIMQSLGYKKVRTRVGRSRDFYYVMSDQEPPVVATP